MLSAEVLCIFDTGSFPIIIPKIMEAMATRAEIMAIIIIRSALLLLRLPPLLFRGGAGLRRGAEWGGAGTAFSACAAFDMFVVLGACAECPQWQVTSVLCERGFACAASCCGVVAPDIAPVIAPVLVPASVIAGVVTALRSDLPAAISTVSD